MPSASTSGRLGRFVQFAAALLVVLVIGNMTATAILQGEFKLLIGAGVGILFVVLGVTQPRIALWAWLLLAPVASRYGTVSLPVGLPDITFSRIVVGIVVTGLLLRRALLGEPLRPLKPLDWAMLIFVSIMGVDLVLRGENFLSEALQDFDELIVHVVLFITARHFLTRREDIRVATAMLLVVGCVLAAHGAYQFVRFTGWAAPEDYAPVERVAGARVNENQLAEGRSIGPFASPVEYGSVCAVSFAAALIVVMHQFPGLPRSLGLVALVASAAGVLLSATRSAWLAPVVAALVIATLDRQRRAAILVSFAALAATILAVVLLVLPRSDLFVARAYSATPISARAMMYRIGARLAVRKPIEGYGRGIPALLAARQEARDIGGPDAEIAAGQFHNTFLMTLVEWGIFGLVTYVTILLLMVHLGLAVRRLAGDDDLLFHFGGFYVAAIALFVVQNLLVDTPAFQYLNGMLFMFAGMLQAQRDQLAHSGETDRVISAPRTAVARA
jgi:O-antigen ligase